MRQKNLKTPEGGHYSPESPETGEGGLTQPKIRVCGWGGELFSIKWLKLIPRNNGGGRESAFLVYFILAFSRRRAVFCLFVVSVCFVSEGK